MTTGNSGACAALFKGVHAVAWGLPDALPVAPGTLWRWRGQALRLDRGAEALWLGRPLGRGDHRDRARARAGRLAPRLQAQHPAPDPDAAEGSAPPGGLVLTDGRRLYPARLVRTARGTAIVFDPWLPPPETDLWVTASEDPASTARQSEPCGLMAGAMVDTPGGPRPAEDLLPGDMAMTRDHGPQPVIWRGETRLSGAELALYPHLRPLRVMPGAFGADATGARPGRVLRVAPGQHLLVPLPGGVAGATGLAAAADLEDGGRIRRDLGAMSATFIHLMLARHEILRVDGMDCASFHPALADAVALRWHARGIERAMPGMTRNPARYGDPARRCLTAADAALLRYAA